MYPSLVFLPSGRTKPPSFPASHGLLVPASTEPDEVLRRKFFTVCRFGDELAPAFFAVSAASVRPAETEGKDGTLAVGSYTKMEDIDHVCFGLSLIWTGQPISSLLPHVAFCDIVICFGYQRFECDPKFHTDTCGDAHSVMLLLDTRGKLTKFVGIVGGHWIIASKDSASSNAWAYVMWMTDDDVFSMCFPLQGAVFGDVSPRHQCGG